MLAKRGRGRDARARTKPKKAPTKPTPSTGMQLSHLERPRLQLFSGFFDVGVGGDTGNQCLDPLEKPGLISKRRLVRLQRLQGLVFG